MRTISNQNGYVISRKDHTAYGENIGAGVGLRSTLKGYFDSPDTRQGYGLTERDEATGLDHTWFRKNEGQAGRWTSPDPYLGSMNPGDPQSFNRYSYVQGDPVNFVDPSGLLMLTIGSSLYRCTITSTSVDGGPAGNFEIHCERIMNFGGNGGYSYLPVVESGGGGVGIGSAQAGQNQPEKKRKCKQDNAGGDAAAIRDAQQRAGISGFIQGQSQSANSPEGLLGTTNDRDGLLAALKSNPAFFYDTGMGGLHSKDVGEQNIDSRSRVLSGPGLGRDIRGMRSSLQVVVGQTNPRTGEAPVYSDLDCVNPAEGAAPFLMHGAPIAVKRAGRFFRRIFR